MALQMVVGRAGAGKSHYLYKNLIDKSLEYRNKNCIALVPEQFSMETQKQILTMHPNYGSFNIEVTSMTRLAYTVFEKQGFSGYKVMDELGKTLVMRKVLEQCKNSLSIYKNKTSMPGFAEKMKTIVSELKQYGIDNNVLENMMEDCSAKPLLKHKLKDVEIINNAFNDYINEKVITAEDVLSIFCKHIPDSEFIKNTYFYIDGFTGFTPIQYQVIELLIKHSSGVKICITLPEDEIATLNNFNKYELFHLSKDTINNILNITDSNNVEVEDMVVVGKNEAPYRIRNNKELIFAEKNIFRTRNIKKYKENCNAVEIHSLSNPRDEAAFVAGRISELIIDKGYRYNDIAVITGDMEGYYRYIEEEFSKNNIPAFIDHKRNIASNPFIDGIKAAIEVVEKDFSYETVFHLIRLGFLPIDKEVADLMENYVLQSGRRRFKSYNSEWIKVYKGFSKENLETINEGRKILVDIISPLRDRIKKNNCTVLEYTKAVYDFVVSNDMQRKIDNYRIMFENQGEINRAKEFEQVYATIITLFERIVELMGEEVMSLKEYKQILQAGFESVKVGIIPPGLDTIMVGDIERTRLKDTKKIIFFMGVNDGCIPKSGQAGGIITDSDREFLEGSDYRLAPTATDNVFKQKFYLYSIFAKPTEKICLSFSKSGQDGSTMRKSYLINTLLNLFENLKIEDEDRNRTDIKNIITKHKALDYLSQNIYRFYKGENSKEVEKLLNILIDDEKDRKYVELMIKGATYKSKNPVLDENVARKLYGNRENIGITRLECYAACAYSQFLSNGLKLGERKKFEIAAFDIGNLYHYAIKDFFDTVNKKNIKWADLDNNTADKIMSVCIENVMKEYDNDALNDIASSMFIRKQVRDISTETINVLVSHIKAGKFLPKEYELKIAHGRIDRVDTYEEGNNIFVRVIDYKSGNKTFNVSETFFGLQMQLMVYLKDAVDYEKNNNPDKNVYPAGGLYFHVHNPYITRPDFEKYINDFRENNPDSGITDDELKRMAVNEERFKEYRMSGLVAKEKEIINAMDYNTITKTGSSAIIPVNITKTGLDSRSNAVETKTYSKFVNYVCDMAMDMQDKIIKGDIRINPVEDACTYCPYSSICNFDRKLGDRYREVEKVTLADIEEKCNEVDE